MSDTSILAAGAALYQYQGSAFYIVGYNSKKLPKAVQNYSVTELEVFGLDKVSTQCYLCNCK